jgi:hypothetical protein
MKPIQPTSLVRAMALAAAVGLFAQPAPAQENFSAKPAPQLFASDCTGSGCHKGPQGLAKGQSQLGLATFLREHYTNSRESASALASYLMKLPSATEARTPRAHPSARSSRAAARPEEEAQPPAARPHRGAEPPSPTARGQRGRQTTAVTPPPPPVPPEPPEPAAAPPPPRQFDIFD